MNQRSTGGFTIGAVLGALVLWNAAAQDAQVGQASTAASTTNDPRQSDSSKPAARATQGDHPDGKSQPLSGETGKLSPGVDEVLQMVQAGVSTEVIKDFIEHSSIPYKLNATDIIALKNHSVP